MESGEGMGGGVECGEGLGVQAVMRDGAVHSGAGNEGWLRDGGGSSGIYLRDWADTDDRERLYRSYRLQYFICTTSTNTNMPPSP